MRLRTITLLTALAFGTYNQLYAADALLKVNLSDSIRPVTHVATGSLYGLTETLPGDIGNDVAPLKPNVFLAPARSGKGYQQGIGGAFLIAPRISGTTGKVQIRLADILPGWPYKFVSMKAWKDSVTAVVNDKKKAKVQNFDGYEIWNEPDGTWKSSEIDFNSGLWKQTYDLLRELDPGAKIIGPSYSWYNSGRMEEFLKYCSQNKCLPDVISWHQWGSEGLVGAIENLRNLEKKYGISPRAISINEYSSSTHTLEGCPGVSVPFIAKFERHGVESAMISWWFTNLPGRLGSLLTADNKRGGGWWLYKWYGDMSGYMANVTPPNDKSDKIDGFAAVNNIKKEASIVIGGNTVGTVDVEINGIPVLWGNHLKVDVEEVKWQDKDKAVDGTSLVSSQEYSISGGSLKVAVKVADPYYAYRIRLKPIVEQAPFNGITHNIPGLVEFEDFDFGGEGVAYHDEEEENKGEHYRPAEGVDIDSNGSNGFVIGWTMKGEWMSYKVNIEAADRYTFSAKVASGLDGSAFRLFLDDKDISGTIEVPNTGSWTDYTTITGTTATLPMGEHQLKVYIESAYCNLDHITFKAKNPQVEYVFTSPSSDMKVKVGEEFTVSWTSSEDVDGNFKLKWINGENGEATTLKEGARSSDSHTATIPTQYEGQAGHYELTRSEGGLIPDDFDGELHTISNPLIWADVPDVSVCRVGDTYYMASTTMHMNPGVPIMASKDLVRWRTINYAHQALGKNDNLDMENGKNAYGKGSWASSIKYKDGTWYVLTPSYTTGKTHIFKTKDIEGGTWQSATLPFYHDPSLLLDDDGRVYVIYGSGNISIVELSEDAMSVKSGTGKTLLTKPASIAGSNFYVECEGSQAMKRNGYYYIFLISWPSNSCRSVICYRSKSLNGPFEGKELLQDNGVAQGGIFDTPDGNWYGMFFRDNGSVGRIPYLMPVSWSNDWPVLGNNGKVPSTLQMPASKEEGYGIVTSDEFEEEKLPLEWQWNHNPDNKHWSLSDGVLRLSNGRTDASLVNTKNTLTQRSFGPQCTGYTKLSTKGMVDGDYAGLCALQEKYGFAGVKVSGNNKYIVMVDATSGNAKEAESIALNQNDVWLRIDMNFTNQADRSTFYYSLDGNTWKQFGNTIKMEYTLTHFMGYRYGLFSFGTKSTNGYADFDFFRIGNTVNNPIYLDKEGNDIVVAKSSDILFVKELTGVGVAACNKVGIGPNPTSEYVTVSTTDELVGLELYTIKGQKIVNSHDNRISVAGLEAGTYLLRVVGKNSSETHKVIVK